MSTSDEALATLEKAALEVRKSADATLGGVGFACFATGRDQEDAFRKARAKLAAAQAIVESVAAFKTDTALMTEPPRPAQTYESVLILEGLKKQVHEIMYGREPTSPQEWRLANVLACVIDIMIDDMKRKRT